MISTRNRMLSALALIISLAVFAAGQDAPAQPKADDSVTHTAFRGKVFEVKYRDGRALAAALRPLGSGFRGATISYSEEFRTLTVRDFPENIAAIEEALKRLDAPQAPRPDMELRISVLVASNVEGASNPYPADLNDVVKQLQATLNYKNYYLLASNVQRVKDGAIQLQGQGMAELNPPLVAQSALATYQFRGNAISAAPSASGGVVFQMNDFEFTLSSNQGNANLRTGLTLRDGEKVVVGTSTLKDKGIVVVLTARSVK